jgi:hypothetical protein
MHIHAPPPVRTRTWRPCFRGSTLLPAVPLRRYCRRSLHLLRTGRRQAYRDERFPYRSTCGSGGVFIEACQTPHTQLLKAEGRPLTDSTERLLVSVITTELIVCMILSYVKQALG